MALAFVAVLTLLVLVIALPSHLPGSRRPTDTASGRHPHRAYTPHRASAASSVPNDPDLCPRAKQRIAGSFRHRCRRHRWNPAEITARRRDLDPQLREASLRRREGDRAPAHRGGAEGAWRQSTDCVKKRDEALSHPIPSASRGDRNGRGDRRSDGRLATSSTASTQSRAGACGAPRTPQHEALRCARSVSTDCTTPSLDANLRRRYPN